MTDTNTRTRRLTRWVAAIVAVGAVGYLGYLWGSSPGLGRPAVAETPAGETPKISDPGAAPIPSAGSGRDGLTPSEVTRAARLAVDDGLRATTLDVTGAPGPEQLSVGLPGSTAPDGHRRASVLLYDYRTDRLLKYVVDLTAGRVDDTFSGTGRQPPPTAREIATAAGLLWGDDTAALLRDRFRVATGATLTSLDQVSIEAQTFSSDDGDKGPAAACGTHRCLMLLPQPAGREFLDLTDVVVDLSTRTVVRLEAR
jgi:hypothetical protein